MAKTRVEDQKNKPSPAPTRKTVFENDLDKSVEKNIIHKGEKVKKRYWRFELYPESLPDGWLDFLKQTCVEFALSPLHDKDVYTKNVRAEDDTDLVQGKVGETKKPHYHGIFAFANPTTFNNVYESFLKPLGQPIPLSCDNVRRAYEYFWHKNDPDKYQYDKADVRTFNGFDVLNYINIEQRRVFEIKKELVKFIQRRPIYEAIDFLDEIESAFSDKEDLEDYLEIAFSHTTIFNIYIRSNRHKNEKKSGNQVSEENPDTDEIADQALSQEQKEC